MQDLAAAFIGIAIMVAFAGGLVWLIGASPLVIITALVLAMAVIDVVRTLREEAGNSKS
jgi:Flp pilus assembly protein TadB